MSRKNNGSRIFLTELMFSILFFMIVAAVCVQGFTLAYVLSSKAKETTEAVNIASNAAEVFLGSDDFSDFTYYYDSEFNTTNSDRQYSMTGIVTDFEGMRTLSITVADLTDGSEIYALNIEKAVYLED